MRICYIADAASAHTQKWAAYFAQEHEVHVLSFRESVIPGVQVHHLGSLSRLGKARYPFQVPHVRRLLRRIRPDLVHALALTSYGFIAALAGRHPLVTSVWGHDILWAPDRSPLHLWITRFGLSRADIVTATGDALAEATRAYMPAGKPVYVVPYGIDLGQFSPAPGPGTVPAWLAGSEGGRPVIASVKALRPDMGFEFLVEAMATVVGRHPDARLLLAGEGTARPALEKQVQRLSLTRSVQFLGHVPHAQVPDLLRYADLYAQPSLTESFGVSVLEASATAIPVVATAVEGGRDVVRDGETGFLVPPGSSSALSQAILRLLDDPSLRESMGAAGRRFVSERYEWRQNAAQMAGFYAQAIEAHRARTR